MINVEDEAVYGVSCAYTPQDAQGVAYAITTALSAVHRIQERHSHTLTRHPRVHITGNELAVYYRQSDIKASGGTP